LRPLHAIIALLFLPLAVAHFAFRASLPALDGRPHVPGLAHPVWIERDALGIPTITAENRIELAFGTGYVHAQDRFFQMDLARRFASGDLAGLFGAGARSHDQLARSFHFRRVARQAVALLDPVDKQILEAYTAGVNEGLASLGSRPWEFWFLQHVPIEWHAEDTLLVIYAMWWDLQYGERARGELRLDINARLRGEPDRDGWKPAMKFLFPAATRWDAPIDAAERQRAIGGSPPIPDASEIDVHRAPLTSARSLEAMEFPGSNNWALSGARSRTGAALVAGDMHLHLGVPAVWYRARLRSGSLDLNGITLPGGPLLVAGSNGAIAWSFTNSYGHWLEVDPTTRAVHWLATDPRATNLRLIALETARSATEALRLAPEIGIPHQNLVVGDRDGHVAWTIAGRIPRAADWMRTPRHTDWLGAGEVPAILDPPSGAVWSANARVTDERAVLSLLGGTYAAIGSGYDLGARAAQVRDDLAALTSPAGPAEMARIQLDDRAVLLEQWRKRLLEVLEAASLAGHPARAEMRNLVQQWDARAAPQSVGYRIVASFAGKTRNALWQSILSSLAVRSGSAPEASFEEPLARILEAQPVNFLPANFSDWHGFLLAQADATLSDLQRECGSLAHCTWGLHNIVRVRHPMSTALPWLSKLIDMPPLALPGDRDMPRVQGVDFGASDRMVVSPGFEAQGILTIAGGQSAHPLSAYYRAGFDQWAKGLPLPLLPGPTRHRLELSP